MIYTTLNKILAARPCGQEIREDKKLRGWLKLLHYLNKTEADDEPLGYDVILKSNGFKDVMWCSQTAPENNAFWRLLSVKFARTLQPLMAKQARDVTERHARGNATDEELESALAANEVACKAVSAKSVAWLAFSVVRLLPQEKLEKIFIDALNAGVTK